MPNEARKFQFHSLRFCEQAKRHSMPGEADGDEPNILRMLVPILPACLPMMEHKAKLKLGL